MVLFNNEPRKYDPIVQMETPYRVPHANKMSHLCPSVKQVIACIFIQSNTLDIDTVLQRR